MLDFESSRKRASSEPATQGGGRDLQKSASPPARPEVERFTTPAVRRSRCLYPTDPNPPTYTEPTAFVDPPAPLNGPNKLDADKPLTLPPPGLPPLPPASDLVLVLNARLAALWAFRSSYTRTAKAATIAPAPAREENVRVWRAWPNVMSDIRTYLDRGRVSGRR